MIEILYEILHYSGFDCFWIQEEHEEQVLVFLPKKTYIIIIIIIIKLKNINYFYFFNYTDMVFFFIFYFLFLIQKMLM